MVLGAVLNLKESSCQNARHIRRWTGFEYWRQARIIGELPVGERAAALAEATAAIAKKTGLTALKDIPFGAPVFTAFEGMNRPKSKHHADSALLLTKGDDVSLDYCENYEP